MAELLLILSGDAGGEPNTRYRVTQQLSPRVVIVKAGDMSAARTGDGAETDGPSARTSLGGWA